jgi:Zn-dependent M28 family amino/carboxypeptidase
MLEAISLLINLDMVGTGSEGITIVNSIAYKELLDDMIEINEKNNYLSKIKERGESCNSDHCAFYNKGVKSIFIYTMGQEHLAYHTPDDTADKIPFTAYNGLFGLLIYYVLTLD